jgi:poly-gamma-glutamate capsule biosynthesis protein CapA/YwtB (metallophosphatase superfamily)
MRPGRIFRIVPFVVLVSCTASQGADRTDAVRKVSAPAAASATATVTIAAVGDAMLGNTPELPPEPGKYFDPIEDALTAPLTFGNLEGTLTTATHSKCGSGSSQCFAFRDPPSYAAYFHDAGFDVLNSANNHSHDFGDAGFRQTTRALHAHEIAQTGLIGEITAVSSNGLKLAFLGFAPYDDVSNLLDLDTARRMIRKATTEADLVVVYMHAGAEGSDRDHVTRHEEHFLGEDRGNPYRFAHMAVDNGADLVLASGPHVLRGMEIYSHRLIAYSLGNFANYHNFSNDGVLAYSGVLRVTIGTKGWVKAGRFISARLNDDGRALHDYDRHALHFVAQLSRQDFPKRGVRFTDDGRIESSA